jgi:transcription elongation factor Elf1
MRDFQTNRKACAFCDSENITMENIGRHVETWIIKCVDCGETSNFLTPEQFKTQMFVDEIEARSIERRTKKV